MKRVDQTIFSTDPNRPGNCFSACVATWLGRPLEEVPHFLEHGQRANGPDDRIVWWAMAQGFMAAHGYHPVTLASVDDVQPHETVFAAGPSPRGIQHQVLYRAGELWHDHHPSRAGLLEVTEVEAWHPISYNHEPTPIDLDNRVDEYRQAAQ